MKILYTLRGVIIAVVVCAPRAQAAPLATWDKIIKGAGRFQVLTSFNGEAVLDKETGLVWEQEPSALLDDWAGAQAHCITRRVGGRKGWRLPTIQELTSLLDLNNPGGNPDLPPGHPLSNVQAAGYWSATTDASNTAEAWITSFEFTSDITTAKTNNSRRWCVRSGHGGPDAQ